MFRFAFLALGLLVILSLPASADPAQHPSHGHPSDRRDPAAGEKAIPVSWSKGDITFHGKLFNWDELSPAERYILRGVQSSNLPSGSAMAPWWLAIYNICTEYERIVGTLPDLMDEEALRRIPRLQDATLLHLSEFRNPITGEWPRVNASYFSPGDVYIRKLTAADKRHYEALNPAYKLYWSLRGPDTVVYYLRIYGEREVVLSNFVYMMGPITHR